MHCCIVLFFCQCCIFLYCFIIVVFSPLVKKKKKSFVCPRICEKLCDLRSCHSYCENFACRLYFMPSREDGLEPRQKINKKIYIPSSDIRPLRFNDDATAWNRFCCSEPCTQYRQKKVRRSVVLYFSTSHFSVILTRRFWNERNREKNLNCLVKSIEKKEYIFKFNVEDKRHRWPTILLH